VKYLLKAYYPEKHEELFGKGFIDNSPSKSMRFIHFSLFKSEWKMINNENLIFWLQIHRVLSYIFYFIGVFSLGYAFIVIIQEIFIR